MRFFYYNYLRELGNRPIHVGLVGELLTTEDNNNIRGLLPIR